MADCTNALKRWTGKRTASVVFDSTDDEFTDAWLFVDVRGMPNIALIVSRVDLDGFGGFDSVVVTKQVNTSTTPTLHPLDRVAQLL